PVGRRAANAGHRPRAHEPAAAAAAGRAVARPGAADREADLPGHPRHQPHGGRDRLPGRAERLSRVAAGASRLRHGERADPPQRLGPRSACQRRCPRRLSRGRASGAIGMDESTASPSVWSQILNFGDPLGATWLQFLLLTVIVFGFAAFMMGRALGDTWRPRWQNTAYGLLLGVANRLFQNFLCGN